MYPVGVGPAERILTLGWNEWKEMLYPCYACSELSSCEVLLPLTAFCTQNWWERSVALGADVICSGCAAKRSAGTKATQCGTLKRKASYYCTKCKCQQPEDSFDPAMVKA
jgi:hypothetical protein